MAAPLSRNAKRKARTQKFTPRKSAGGIVFETWQPNPKKDVTLERYVETKKRRRGGGGGENLFLTVGTLPRIRVRTVRRHLLEMAEATID